jgi:hypothetical protein
MQPKMLANREVVGPSVLENWGGERKRHCPKRNSVANWEIGGVDRVAVEVSVWR